jgi:hypothetical protein
MKLVARTGRGPLQIKFLAQPGQSATPRTLIGFGVARDLLVGFHTMHTMSAGQCYLLERGRRQTNETREHIKDIVARRV